ncbi:MAG: Alkaline phosphatase [Acidimicrobiales bacterium]|nr:Alkaline phosphatase [Acidimicrobiales bacterium]
MNQGEREDERRSAQSVSRLGGGIGRRHFLTGAAATAAVIAAGCSSSGSDDAVGSGKAAGTASTTTRHSAKLAADPFTLGVASGDPLADRVILWTRLAPDAVAADGLGGMRADKVDVVWEVATDARFSSLVAGGVSTADPGHGHSIHVDATGLEPGTDYRYRFRVGSYTSPVGRTRTLPDGDAERFALAVANCQWYETGTYAAYRHMVDEDIDVVVHLGDYIYEAPGGLGAVVDGRASLPAGGLRELADYRVRYGSYKLDPDLLAVHARHPFFCTWDDHEVVNNYMGDTAPGTITAAAMQERKAAAYQAWWEHLPVRLDPPTGSDLTVYRSLDAGNLARLYLLDERQDSAVPPCRDTTNGALDYGDCDARTAEDRTRLGKPQEEWLASELDKGGVTWNLLGNPVVLAGVDGGTDASAYYLDTWDGFPQARERLIAQLADVDNPVVLTGDYHAGMVLDVRAKPFDQSSDLVAPEFMSPPISSTLFPADVSARTPHLRQQINEYGYLTVEATPDRLTARFRTVDDVTDAKSGIATAATWTVDAGDPSATKA